ncbi:TPA: hypothetical protein I7730_16260 [Vibrio vulnificus]|uniref:Uncharacterized protein n=1 Tax=Vibrio vulnificus TaxID=672 RepID=A0A8H9N215_VIBVL|nr:hypothetical protein [Vibrio vulnificus]HAS8541338.1 hypothetical protein [Vibrio vulnificus]
MNSEEKAIQRFNRFGRDTLEKIFNRIHLRADDRKKADIGHLVETEEWAATCRSTRYLTETETSILHSIKLALMLCTNPAEEAKQKVLTRVQERRERRKALALAA